MPKQGNPLAGRLNLEALAIKTSANYIELPRRICTMRTFKLDMGKHSKNKKDIKILSEVF